MQKDSHQTEMAGSEGIQAIVYQAAIKVATAVMMGLKDADVGPWPAAAAGPRELQRHDRPALERPSLNWNAQDMYTELLNSEVEVMNILQTRTYELTGEENAPIIKNWLGREGLQLIKTLANEEKEKCKTAKRLFCAKP